MGIDIGGWGVAWEGRWYRESIAFSPLAHGTVLMRDGCRISGIIFPINGMVKTGVLWMIDYTSGVGQLRRNVL